MIRSLRQRHRVMVFTLSAFLPAAFGLGIASRRAVPLVPELPSNLVRQQPQAYQSVWVREDLWEKYSLRTRLLADSTHQISAVEVAAKQPLIRPDLLLYWVPGNTKIEDLPPKNSVLLGAWMQNPARPVRLPPEAKIGPGKLILYSLADHEIVNVTKSLTIQ